MGQNGSSAAALNTRRKLLDIATVSKDTPADADAMARPDTLGATPSVVIASAARYGVSPVAAIVVATRPDTNEAVAGVTAVADKAHDSNDRWLAPRGDPPSGAPPDMASPEIQTRSDAEAKDRAAPLPPALPAVNAADADAMPVALVAMPAPASDAEQEPRASAAAKAAGTIDAPTTETEADAFTAATAPHIAESATIELAPREMP